MLGVVHVLLHFEDIFVWRQRVPELTRSPAAGLACVWVDPGSPLRLAAARMSPLPRQMEQT